MGNNSSIEGSSGSSPKAASSIPLQFHTTCGENVRLEAGGRRAIRTESFCKGICFSNRPVHVNERVCVRVVSLSTNWSGFLRVGFSAHDPSTLNRKELPRYSCPDLTSLPGYWAKALPDLFSAVNNVICFCVTADGDVLLMLNKENFGVLLSGVDTKSKLWAIVDIYGNCTGVELTDDVGVARSIRMPAAIELPTNAPLKYYRNTGPQTMFFHAFCGKNVSLNPVRTIATRHASQYDNGYVFTSQPLGINERIVVQILTLDKSYTGGLTAGVTSCDPAVLRKEDMPDDSDALLDRSEYWVVHKNVYLNAACGDELAFCLSAEGELNFGKNGSPSVPIMHVDKTIPLWLFFDIFGEISKLRLHGVLSGAAPAPPTAVVDGAGSSPLPHPVASLSYARRLPPLQQRLPHNEEGLRVELPPPLLTQPAVQRLQDNTEINISLCQTRSALPPVPPRISRRQGESESSSGSNSSSLNLSRPHSASSAVGAASQPLPTRTEGALSDGCSRSPDFVVIDAVPAVGLTAAAAAAAAATGNSKADDQPPGATSGGPECIVCFEKACNAVIYTCGHVCMCYECALSIKQQASPQCPICRQAIQDVIRMFRS